MPKLPPNIGAESWRKQVYDFCAKNKVNLEKWQSYWAAWYIRDRLAQGMLKVLKEVSPITIMPSIFIELDWVYKQIHNWSLKDIDGNLIDELAQNYGCPNLAFLSDLFSLSKQKELEGQKYALREVERQFFSQTEENRVLGLFK